MVTWPMGRQAIHRLPSGRVDGRSTRFIADKLCISMATTRNHTQAVMAKLGAHTRLEAVAVARWPTPVAG